MPKIQLPESQNYKTQKSENFIKPPKNYKNYRGIPSEKMTYLESHGASSSCNFSFLRWNTLLTAKHMNRVIRVTLSRSNGSCNPPPPPPIAEEHNFQYIIFINNFEILQEVPEIASHF